MASWSKLWAAFPAAGVTMGKRSLPGVAVSPDARRILEVYKLDAGELLEAWLASEDDLVVFAPHGGKRSGVIIAVEDRGILQLLTPDDVRSSTPEGG